MKWFFLSISVIIIIGIAYLSPKNYVFASLMDGGDQFFNANTEVEVFKTQPDGLSSIGSVDIFTNKLQFQLPQDWQLAFSRSENNMSTSEFISTKSSLNMWSEMICVQGFKGLGRHASPKVFFAEMVGSYKGNCQGELIYQPLGETQFGDKNAYHALLGCSSLPNLHQAEHASSMSQLQGEMGYFAVVSLDNDLMMLHKSMRGGAFSNDNAPLTEDNYLAFIEHLQPNILSSNHE